MLKEVLLPVTKTPVYDTTEA